MIWLSLLLLQLAAPAAAAAPSAPGAVIHEGLDLYCVDWLARRAATPAPSNPKGAAASWREQRSAQPAVGPILIKGGSWGQASVVRVAQAEGHRCSIAIQLAASGWTTEPAYVAVADWTAKTWPRATLVKDRGEGPRGTRESVWRIGADTLTLQEAPGPGAQPNVFITVQRAREI